MVDMSMLSATRLFQGLPPDAVAAVAAGAAVRRLRRHDVMFEEGDPASELFLVQEGRIAIAN
jgi:CRP-like cAMP-binding protein